MKLCSLLFGFFLVAGAGLAKPHVLFVSIDDMNDYISPLDNHPGINTPNFDRLAKRSVTFANAHCAAPACDPSRVAVMTGVHPVKSGIYRNMFGAQGPRWRHESAMLETRWCCPSIFAITATWRLVVERFFTRYSGRRGTHKMIPRRGMIIAAIPTTRFRPIGQGRNWCRIWMPV